VVETPNHGLQGVISECFGGQGELEIFGPGEVLVVRKKDEETPGVKCPPQNILNLHWSSFGFELLGRKKRASLNGFGAAGVRAAGHVDGKGDSKWAASAIGRCVQER
jgi:hypothetical protein